MSLIASITKKSKLNATIKQAALARNSEGHTANGLYKAAYLSYAEILQDDPLRADTLYQWGFALLHQAKTKAANEADKIYQDAIEKFAFCLLINPYYLGAAINGGVAYMDLARLKQVPPDDRLYDMAKIQFDKANSIQAGTASYNLACIYALRGQHEASLKALEHARDKVTLPDAEEILNDPDLAGIVALDWFLGFMDSLTKKAEADVQEAQQAAVKKTDSKWVLVDRTAELADDAQPEQEATTETVAAADEPVDAAPEASTEDSKPTTENS